MGVGYLLSLVYIPFLILLLLGVVEVVIMGLVVLLMVEEVEVDY